MRQLVLGLAVLGLIVVSGATARANDFDSVAAGDLGSLTAELQLDRSQPIELAGGYGYGGGCGYGGGWGGYRPGCGYGGGWGGWNGGCYPRTYGGYRGYGYGGYGGYGRGFGAYGPNYGFNFRF